MSGRAGRTNNGAATRDRILEVAAALFARRGYHGTSTREIAGEVGIRQPSLFHHFATKQDILAELLERDLRPALERLRRNRVAPPAVRLYAYLMEDVRALSESPFDTRGLYADEVLLDPELAPLLDKQKALHDETRRVVADGIADGSFRDIDPCFGRRVVTAMLLDTIWMISTEPEADCSHLPEQVAEYVLRGLLVDLDSLERVKAEAKTLVSGDDADAGA